MPPAANTPDTRSAPILSTVYGALTKVFGGLWSRYGGWGWSRIRLFLPGARFDWEREAADVWMNSIVGLAISWLGDRFPRPRIHVSKILRTGDHQPLGRSPLVDLWNRPNRYYGRRTLEKAIGLSLKVDGNAYLYKVRDKMGQVVELWWVPHFRILPTWPADGSSYIDGYRVWLDTAVYHLPPQDILHIRDGIDPRNERLGLAAVRASLREVCTINYESSYTGALLKNSGVPGIAIVPDGPTPARPSREDAERIKERFRDNFSGDNTGDPVVLAGSYRVEPIGFTPEAMAIDVLPRNAQARVAAAIGVAAMSLGLPDPNKTYSNLAEANRTSWGTIVAVQELIAEAVRWDLLPEFGLDPDNFTVEYDYTHIQELQESLDSLHTRTRDDFKADLITRNEAREQLGYEPVPDGDQFFSELAAGAGSDGSADGPGLPPPAQTGKGIRRQLEHAAALSPNGNGNGHGGDSWRY
jgi:HK97 family phage portal protein